MFHRYRKIIPVFLGVFFLAALTFLTRWFHDFSERPVDVNLDSAEMIPKGGESSPLRFAIAPIQSTEKTAEYYRALPGYLALKLNQPVRIVQRKTYGEINELLRSGMVQVAIVCTGTYLRALADNIPVEAIAVPVYPEGPVYHSLVVVRSDSGIESFKDLEGRPFAFTDPLSFSGYYYPVYLLREANRKPQSFFSRIIFTYSHDASMNALVDGIVDGTTINNIVYDLQTSQDPSLRQKLKIIHQSPPFGVTPVVVPASIDPEIRKRLIQALLEMDNSPEGSQILASLNIARFESPPPDLYHGASEIFEKVQIFLETKKAN